MKESSPSNSFSDLADHLNTWSKNEPTPRLASLDLGDFSTIIYDFFTGDQTGINFITNIGLQVPFLIPITGGEIYPLLQNPKTSLIPLQYAYNLVGYLGSHLVWQVMYNHQLVCCPKCHVFCWTLKKLTLISFLLTSGHLRHREFGEVTRLVNKCRDCSTFCSNHDNHDKMD